MSKEDKVLDQEFAGLAPRDLLNEAQVVLDNPLLRRIVETGEPANACDEWVKKLGFPNDIARAVRAAAKFRDSVSRENWKLFEHTFKRPAQVMAEISENSICPGELTRLVNFKIGSTWDPRANLPFMLSDFALGLSGQGYYLTTIDGDGSMFPFLEQSDPNTGAFWNTVFIEDHNVLPYSLQGGWTFQYHTVTGHGRFTHKRFDAISKLSLVKMPFKAHRFPRLIKSVEVCKLPPYQGVFERIRAYVYADCALFARDHEQPSQVAGKFTYERIVPPPKSSLCNLGHSAVLEVKYDILTRSPLELPCCALALDEAEADNGKVTILPWVGNGLAEGLSDPMTEDIRGLVLLSERIRNNPAPKIYALLGKEFMDNPPKELVEPLLQG